MKKKYGTMPFNLRNFEEEAKAKMGVHECVTHKLVEPFQVLYEKNSEYIFPHLIIFQFRKENYMFLKCGDRDQTPC